MSQLSYSRVSAGPAAAAALAAGVTALAYPPAPAATNAVTAENEPADTADAAAVDVSGRDSGDDTEEYDELTLLPRAPEISDANANEERSDFTKWGPNIETWPWELSRFGPNRKLDPPHLAAGVIAKMYEPTAKSFDLPAAMLLVMSDVDAFDGGRFPDFTQVLDMQHRVVVDFETLCMTRPMTTDEKRWLSETTRALLTDLNYAEFHKDERDILNFNPLKDKKTLQENVGVDIIPYGMLSGPVNGFCQVEATMHQAKPGGPCLFLSVPVALLWAVKTDLESPYGERLEQVCRCGKDILEKKDPFGRGFRKLLADFVRKEPETSELYINLLATCLPPSFQPSGPVDNRVEEWGLYVEGVENYGNETVWTIIVSFLPFVKHRLITCEVQAGPYYHNPACNIVSSLQNKYSGNSIDILLLLITSEGRSADGEVGQNCHYEPLRLAPAPAVEPAAAPAAPAVTSNTQLSDSEATALTAVAASAAAAAAAADGEL